jgi:hypothetical protein
MKTLSQLLDEKYGPKGTPERDKYDAESLAFRLGVMLKEKNNKNTEE